MHVGSLFKPRCVGKIACQLCRYLDGIQKQIVPFGLFVPVENLRWIAIHSEEDTSILTLMSVFQLSMYIPKFEIEVPNDDPNIIILDRLYMKISRKSGTKIYIRSIHSTFPI